MKNYKYMVRIWDNEFNVPFGSHSSNDMIDIQDYINRMTASDRTSFDVRVYEKTLISSKIIDKTQEGGAK